MMNRFLLLLTFMFACTLSCTNTANDADRVVHFKGRTIDLQPYVEGFPYSGFKPFYAANKLYYYHKGDSTTLREIDLAGEVDLRQGKQVANIDFAKRNVWTTRYQKNDSSLYWVGDERNDEVINLYRLNPRNSELTKLTDVPYIFGWNWNNEGSKIAYVARLGDKEERLSELRILDLQSGEEKTVTRDTPGMRFTWSTPSWHPRGNGVVLGAVKNASRSYGNIVYVDLQSGKTKLITDDTVARNFPTALKDWLSDDEFIYTSNEDGYENLYSYNLQNGKKRQLTRFIKNISEAELIELDGKKYIFAVLSHPIENELYLIDATTLETVQSRTHPENLVLLDNHNNKMMVYATSAVNLFRIDEITVTTDGFSFETRIDLPPGLKEKIVHSNVERITYPTFDIDPETGKKRMLHAYLYKPFNPLPEDERMVMIKSFYGGKNTYSTNTQILTEAGIYVLSPAPRGSHLFGREFMSLNDKDLGGNEIIDIIYAAKYISEKLTIPPNRIGTYGGSHGGYATMRLLTFPGEINGQKADFDWGFGISHAGFSDIIHFYENCNIPDWVTLEAGDPKTEADKLRDRSPLYHADKMSGKLLLTHGTNDSRVPIEGSRQMADSLRAYSKDVTLVEFEGQGHGIKGLENTVRVYKARFNFLEGI